MEGKLAVVKEREGCRGQRSGTENGGPCTDAGKQDGRMVITKLYLMSHMKYS